MDLEAQPARQRAGQSGEPASQSSRARRQPASQPGRQPASTPASQDASQREESIFNSFNFFNFFKWFGGLSGFKNHHFSLGIFKRIKKTMALEGVWRSQFLKENLRKIMNFHVEPLHQIDRNLWFSLGFPLKTDYSRHLPGPSFF